MGGGPGTTNGDGTDENGIDRNELTALLPVSIVTGFLGSGKTTLIARLLRNPAFARTAVIVNEFGEIGLDHELIAASDEQMLTLSTGCLCCAVRADLLATLLDLSARRDAGDIAFDRVLIETSGLADPAPILQALMTDRDVAQRHTIDTLLTLVDAQHGEVTLDRHPEARRQAALADRLLLTKTDVAGPTDRLRARLTALNPGAPLLSAVAGDIAPGMLFTAADANAWLARIATLMDTDARVARLTTLVGGDARSARIATLLGVDPGLEHVVTLAVAPPGSPFARAAHSDDIKTFSLTRDHPLPALALTLWLEALVEQCGERLLRLKGLVNVAEMPGRPALLHGVRHVFAPPDWLDRWPSDDRRTRVVFIGEAMPRYFPVRLLDAIEAEVVDETRRSGVELIVRSREMFRPTQRRGVRGELHG
jgi:G3E family GTPase